jgi:hypothetical protein
MRLVAAAIVQSLGSIVVGQHLDRDCLNARSRQLGFSRYQQPGADPVASGGRSHIQVGDRPGRLRLRVGSLIGLKHHKPLNRRGSCHKQPVGDHMTGDCLRCDGAVGVGCQPRAVLALLGGEVNPTVGDNIYVIDCRRLNDDLIVAVHGYSAFSRLSGAKSVGHDRCW